MNTLILYASTDGQTARIAMRMSEKLEEAGWVVTTASIDDPPVSLASFEAVILGSRVRYGQHDPRLVGYMHKHCEELMTKQTAFYSVNLVARKPDKSSPETNPYLIKLRERSKWMPSLTAVFAGRLNYPVYRWLDKRMIQLIMRMANGPTDTSIVYEFTDWSAVDAFANRILSMTDHSSVTQEIA